MKRISDRKGENAKDKAKETSALTLNWSERDVFRFFACVEKIKIPMRNRTSEFFNKGVSF